MLQYLRGEVKLWKAYWLVSLPISFIIQLITQGFEKNGVVIPLPFSLLLFAVGIYLTIGLFGSAVIYNKEHAGIRKTWGFLVMLQIIVGIILATITAFLIMFR